MKKYFSIFYTLLACVVVLSCKQDYGITDTDKYATVYMAQAASVQEFVFAASAGSDRLQVGASYGGLDHAPEDIKVQFDVDFSLIDDYNEMYGTDYLPLPSGNFTFPQKETTIKTGELQSTPLAINVDFEGLPTFQGYLLPVKITSISGNVPLNENLRTTYFRIEVRSDPVRLKIMILTKGGTSNDMDRLAQIMESVDCDIYLIEGIDRNTNRSGTANDWFEILRQKVHVNYAQWAVNIENFESGRYGIGVYSKHPISNASTHMLLAGGVYDTRGPFALMDLDIGGKTLKLGATQLDWDNTKNSNQAQAIKDIVGEDDGTPFVIIGQFGRNDKGYASVLKLGEVDFVPACTACSGDYAPDPSYWVEMTMFRPSSRFSLISHTIGTSSQTINPEYRPAFTTLDVYF